MGLALLVGCSAGLGSAMGEVDRARRDVERARASASGDSGELYRMLAEQELDRARACVERGDGSGARYWARRARVDAQLAEDAAREAKTRRGIAEAQREARSLTQQLGTEGGAR